MNLYIVVPCFNEEMAIGEAKEVLTKKLDSLGLSDESKVLFVDDGSSDKTWEKIEEAAKENGRVKGVKLSKNFGHQAALLAGISASLKNADAIISIDADLQDDVDKIDVMVEEFKGGADIVLGVRDDRQSDTAFKRKTALLYYKTMKFLGADIVVNHADFRLMSRRAAEALLDFSEVNLFLRGLVPLLGFNTKKVYYARKKRLLGESKYPLKKMLSFAFEGITSLSIKPIRMISLLGFLIFFVSILMLVYSLVRYFSGNTIIGWASIAVSVWAIGGLQLLAIGAIGEYIGKIYLETKKRPRFIIEKEL